MSQPAAEQCETNGGDVGVCSDVWFAVWHVLFLCTVVCDDHSGMYVAETELGTKCVVDMDDKQTVLYNPGLILKDG